MTFEQILFYAYAATLILAAGAVITVRNPVRAALALVLAFVASAGLWMLLEAEFLAIALVLVYVGAVMVLFLFVVMMLDVDIAALRAGFARFLPIGAVVGLLVAGVMVLVLGGDYFGLAHVADPAPHAADYSNTKELGRVLYTTYVFPFEIAAVILLVAIVAAIVLTLRRRQGTKFQEVDEQVAVRRADRVRLVTMAADERK
jgi:NADH-quinone oxidoreductase subunit J